MTNERVRKAIMETKNLIPDYWKATLTQRLPGGNGSTMDANSVEELETKLLEANWEPYEHHAIEKGCVGFKTNDIGGFFGMISLEQVAYEAGTYEPLKVVNPKGLPFSEVELTQSALRSHVKYSVIILGQEQGKEVVFTVHPGHPCTPSKLPVEQYPDGKIVTVLDIMNTGLVKWVKF